MACNCNLLRIVLTVSYSSNFNSLIAIKLSFITKDKVFLSMEN
jgi:hypothetical protein